MEEALKEAGELVDGLGEIRRDLQVEVDEDFRPMDFIGEVRDSLERLSSLALKHNNALGRLRNRILHKDEALY